MFEFKAELFCISHDWLSLKLNTSNKKKWSYHTLPYNTHWNLLQKLGFCLQNQDYARSLFILLTTQAVLQHGFSRVVFLLNVVSPLHGLINSTVMPSPTVVWGWSKGTVNTSKSSNLALGKLSFFTISFSSPIWRSPYHVSHLKTCFSPSAWSAWNALSAVDYAYLPSA